jgi:peptide-methionine (S)-S-oxide reductase
MKGKRNGQFTAALTGITVLLIACFALSLRTTMTRAADAQPAPAPQVDEPAAHAHSEVAVLAGGCFWGIQGVFQHVRGVKEAVSGFTGGSEANASYRLVSTGTTGHAESVQITYDPRVISYGRLLQIFFSIHDPTQLDAQGPDEGTQYRSAVFPMTDEQSQIARQYIAQLNASHAFGSKVVTSVEPGRTFYPAEGYHQNFLVNHPDNGYIVANDLPKVAALQQLFPQEYQPKPVLVPVD